ncbi:MAG TPA: polysaccharide lyase 6 family protein [Candidatus Aquilonibacter sp.]|nr:polysaccharide lyase 6 family protein [Candidatus Aquilonibacter sp.]
MRKIQTCLFLSCVLIAISNLSCSSIRSTSGRGGLSEVKVSSLTGLQSAIDAAKPGTRIVVADGIYSSTGAIHVACAGTAERPIVIAAETRDGAEITGKAGFELVRPAAYVTIEGFKFTHAVEGEQINVGANHCRYSRNVFQNPGLGYELLVSGDDAQIDRNCFQNKFAGGQMVYVQGPGTSGMAQRTWIHLNLFTNYPDTHQNNCSAIQIGLSGRSMTAAHSLVESNLFIRCRGENENICNKSCENTYRYNTFEDNCSELSLRHGNDNIVYGNFFIGTDGLRMFGKRDKIYSNFFESCNRGIHIGNGDGVIPPSKLTSHDRPDGMQIVYNTIINCNNSLMMARRNRGLGATNITFADNIIVGKGRLINIEGPITHSVWEGNILWGETNGLTADMAAGFKVVDPKLKRDANGEYHLSAGSPAVGAGVGSFPYVTVDMDGQPRGVKMDVGADQISKAPVINRILTVADVGPNAP